MRAFLHMAVKNGEIAKRMLEEMKKGKKKYNEEYLKHVIEEGERAKKLLGLE